MNTNFLLALSGMLLLASPAIASGSPGSGTAMTVRQCTVITTTVPAGRGQPSERVVGVNIETTGTLDPLHCYVLDLSLGNTPAADVDTLRVWYTGSGPRLTPAAVLFGSMPFGAGAGIAGDQVLAEGSNFFWVTAGLTENAGEGDTLEGQIGRIRINGEFYTPVNPGTWGRRVILPEHRVLFSGGDHGVVNYRIPAVKTAADGSLVVAADARVERPGDLPNNIDIVVRRSTDRGHTWSAPVTIADFGSSGASDPALVLNRTTGHLLCLFASHRGLMQSTPADPIRLQYCRSSDHGVTWSAPQEFTSSIYQPGWYAAWLASGSAHQTRGGRIVGAVGVRQNAGNVISNFMIFTNDDGRTWGVKTAVASETGDEAKIVELNDGRLMMNIRNQTPDCRKIVVSPDGGNTWSVPRFQPELADPFVNGDLIRFTSVPDRYDKNRLLFSIAADPAVRKNLTVFVSYDEGGSWPVSRVINPGLSGYSCLTILDDGSIGCFYENGEYEEYQLCFARFSLHWLTRGADTLSFPAVTR